MPSLRNSDVLSLLDTAVVCFIPSGTGDGNGLPPPPKKSFSELSAAHDTILSAAHDTILSAAHDTIPLPLGRPTLYGSNSVGLHASIKF